MGRVCVCVFACAFLYISLNACVRVSVFVFVCISVCVNLPEAAPHCGKGDDVILLQHVQTLRGGVISVMKG